MHDQHPIAYRKQPLVMSDHHCCLTQLMGLIRKQMSDVLSPSSVQSGCGLIRQDDVWVVVERHRDGSALTLAPGQLGGVGVGAFRDAERVQKMVPSVGVALRSCCSVVQAELVVESQEGNQTRGLENEADAPQSKPGPLLLRQAGVPLEGVRRPPMMVRSVDFPEPEGPRIPTSSPARSVRSVLCRA